MKKIFLKILRWMNLIDGDDETVNVPKLKESLEQCKEQLQRADDSLLLLRNKYEIKTNQLRITEERYMDLYAKNQELSNKFNDLNNLHYKVKEDSDFVIRTIIECLQNALVLDNETVEREQVMKYFNGQLLKILSHMGIMPIDDIGTLANPQYHRIENVINTDIPEQSGIISQSFGIGFKKGDDCIIEQPVEVYKYKK